MTKKDCRLVENIIKHTAAFKANNIAYELTGKDVTVWSTLFGDNVLYTTKIIPLFTELFLTYVKYDRERDKCVLVIF